jgi:hypothetical protein
MKNGYRLYLLLSTLIIFFGFVVGFNWISILGMLFGALVFIIGGIKGLIDPWRYGWKDLVTSPTMSNKTKWGLNLIRFMSILSILFGLFIIYLVLTW